MTKQQARTRRGLKTKALIRQSNKLRLVVHRSACHIYAQVIKKETNGDCVVVCSSTLDKHIKERIAGKKKAEQAYEVGKLLAERAKEMNVLDVAFDRAGYRYHGRVKALADGAREAGLNF